MVRWYAQGAGVVLVLLGIAGLLAGGQPLLGVLNVDVGETFAHLITGALLVYVGFFEKDEVVMRIVVFPLGLAYLLVGVVGFVVPDLFGLLPSGLSIADDLIHLALGASGIAAVELSRRDPSRKPER